MARVLLPLAWGISILPLYGCTSFGASIIAFGLDSFIVVGASILAFGLGSLNFAIVWLYVVWGGYYCLWPGLIHLCYHMAICRMARVLLPLACVTSSLPSMTVRRMARALLPLAWVNSPLLLYACTPYAASIIVLPHLCHRAAVQRMARVSLRSA